MSGELWWVEKWIKRISRSLRRIRAFAEMSRKRDDGVVVIERDEENGVEELLRRVGGRLYYVKNVHGDVYERELSPRDFLELLRYEVACLEVEVKNLAEDVDNELAGNPDVA